MSSEAFNILVSGLANTFLVSYEHLSHGHYPNSASNGVHHHHVSHAFQLPLRNSTSPKATVLVHPPFGSQKGGHISTLSTFGTGRNRFE
jgi:hypothetical protein